MRVVKRRRGSLDGTQQRRFASEERFEVAWAVAMSIQKRLKKVLGF